MTVTNNSGAAFSCGDLAAIRLLRGTLTATGKDTAFSDVITWNQTRSGNDEIKCMETGSDPEVRADGRSVSSVTLSRCTAHQWSYTQKDGAEQHMRTCALCGYTENGAGIYEPCVYDSVSSLGESGHKTACLCGRIQAGTALVKHTPDYIPNPDGKTHGYRCTVCGFVSDATADQHTYVDGKCSLCGYACPHDDADKTIGSPTEGLCANCGKQAYEARLVRDNGRVVEHYETVEQALARYTSVSDSIVTLLCDKDVGDSALVVTYEISGKELDLGGHTLSGSGDAVFQINKRYGFTLHNGTVKNTGDGDAIQLIHGTDSSWGGTISDGELTVEDITVTATKGWAIHHLRPDAGRERHHRHDEGGRNGRRRRVHMAAAERYDSGCQHAWSYCRMEVYPEGWGYLYRSDRHRNGQGRHGSAVRQTQHGGLYLRRDTQHADPDRQDG